jgi:hypothetical protein
MQAPQDQVPKKQIQEVEDEEEVSLSPPPDSEGSDLAQQATRQLEEEAKKKQVVIQSENIAALLKSLQDHFKDNDWYKKAENQPVQNDDGSITMHFQSPQDMADFSQKQATEKQNFVMIDEKTNKVMAYSNGDGKLYNGDGTEYDAAQKGEFKTGKDYKDFIMPMPDQEKTAEKTKSGAPESTVPKEDNDEEHVTAPKMG